MRLNRVAVVVTTCLVFALSASIVDAGRPVPPPSGPPLIPGSRQVNIRNSSGGLGVFTSIPGSSTFSSYGGGPAAECDGVAAGDDPATLDVVEDQQPIRSTKIIFIEGIVAEIPVPVNLEEYDPTAGGTLAIDDVIRTFSVYCADTFYSSNFKGFIDVAGSDPMLDPRGQITNLYNGLQLDEISLYENEVVDRWGGLVVRNPAWFAINSSAWRGQRSNPQYYRGWELYLILQPKALEFNIDFVPASDRPSPAFSGVVNCVGESDNFEVLQGEFPARPNDLADFAEPGPGGACEWTPPGPGQVTVTATQTFTVTFWASGATEAQPDYPWQSDPVTYEVGELVAVNVNE